MDATPVQKTMTRKHTPDSKSNKMNKRWDCMFFYFWWHLFQKIKKEGFIEEWIRLYYGVSTPWTSSEDQETFEEVKKLNLHFAWRKQGLNLVPMQLFHVANNIPLSRVVLSEP